MWSKVEPYIRAYHLLDAGQSYIVGLSGGADSVALLLLLHDAGYRIEAAHCNFHLRGSESDRDERFCRSLCEQHGIPLHLAHFDTQAYAELHKVSIEMAARELRYRWFEQLCADLSADGICIAHHRDDTVETVLMNLLRGTGLRGLTGIQPRRGRVLRPLLCVSRSEIEDYLERRRQDYVTDSTNLETDALRNKLRLQVIPLLRSINPAAPDCIQQTSEHLCEAQAVLDAVLQPIRESDTLDLRRFPNPSSRRYVAFEWLKDYGFNGSQVRQLLDAATGSLVSSPMGYEVLKDRDRLIVETAQPPMAPLTIPEDGVYVAGCHRISVRRKPAYVSRMPLVATVDAARVRFPLTLRRVESGDWMVPLGMTGRKLLSDLMTDARLTRFQKRRQLLLTDATGRVVWAVALRVDGRFAVGDATAEVLEIAYEESE